MQQHASLRLFNENNYGIPNQYAALILGNDAWLAANPSLAHKFVNALVRAYTFIKNNPAEGARIEYEMNPTAVNLNVAIQSSEAMAKSYLAGPSGQIGVQDPASMAWPALGGLAILIGLWQLIVWLVNPDPTVLPTPARVVSQAWLNRGALRQNAVPTIEETLIGIAAALVVSALVVSAMAAPFRTPPS